jgi:hypothetical protein
MDSPEEKKKAKKSPASAGDLVTLHCADILFCLKTGCHYFMTAAHTAEPEVCAGTKYQPAFLSAGVGLFHNQNIIQTNIHK